MSSTNDQDLLYFNGVNGATGEYGLPPMSADRLAGAVRGEPDEELARDLEIRAQQKDAAHFGVTEGVDPCKIEESGWGILFAHDADPAVQEALQPLIDLRRGQAGDRFRLYERGDGFLVGKDNKNKFLARHGVGPGPVDPEKAPYYMLIVGSPDKIPYRFQTQLDVQYAVGRIDFGDDLDAYDCYARSVVAAETGHVALGRDVAFFGVRNDGDRATEMSSERLIGPLLEHFGEKHSGAGWKVSQHLRDKARKADLARLLGGSATPALLFTASHGMEFPMGDPRQIPHQGALLCQDWPGPRGWQGPIPQDHYFAGDDLPSDANLLGLLGFFFACYGCGTPQLDDFAKQAFKDQRAQIAPHAFLAGLPSRMLSHPGGGALAVIGHVERAWGCSFIWQGAGSQTTVFEATLDRLLAGYPVGNAVEYFNERYAELSTLLSDELEEIEFGKKVDGRDLAGMWTANNDARGYMILGDPAVRLPVASDGKVKERPQLEVVPRDTPLKAKAPTAAASAPPAEPAADADTAQRAVDSFGIGGGDDDERPNAPGKSFAKIFKS